MASPAEIAQVLPDTLPEDFGEWDSENSPATPPVSSGGFEAAPGFGAVPKPQAAVARKVGVLSNVASPIRPNGAQVGGMRNTASLRAAAMRDADEVLFQSIRPNSTNMGRQKRTSKNWIMVAATSAGLIMVLFILIPLFHRGRLPMLRHTAEAQPVATDRQPETNTLVPSPSTGITSGKQAAATDTQQITGTQPATDKKEVILLQVQSKMMHDQLTAPTRIPHDLKSKALDEAPSSLGINAANMGGQGGNGAIGSVFNGQAKFKVNAAPPKTVTVSTGIAGGLLIHSTAPIYPAIAKSAHVAGTVVLKATISKTGIVENVHFVSGPAMLSQAALDAVRTWRYKPYKLNNEPVEIETTVNVNFTLGG
jgi:protein TonB